MKLSISSLLSIFLFTTSWGFAQPKTIEPDICIYGATPAGITAAIAAKLEGRTVVIVEPSRWVGGMLGAGLKPIQDCPNIDAVGGLAKQFIFSLGVDDDISGMSHRDVVNYLKQRSPKDIRDDFLTALQDHKISVIFEHRLNLCTTENQKITEVVFDLAHFDESGCPPIHPAKKSQLKIKAKVYIDASYEGELMARAGVSYRTGRESEDAFDEENAGVRPPVLLTPIDPYI